MSAGARDNARSRRGRPLWALGGILLGWIGLRAALIDLPRTGLPAPPPRLTAIAKLARPLAPAAAAVRAGPSMAGPAMAGPAFASPWVVAGPSPRPGLAAMWPVPPDTASRASPPPPPPPLARPLPEPAPPRVVAGHNLLWMAAMRAIPLPTEIAAAFASALAPAALPPGDASGARRARFSADAWLAWRAGARGLASAGGATPVYGGSQAGAVLRYDLAAASRHRPAAYLRAVQAVAARESDLAGGLALRPVPAVPVTVQAEARLTRRGDKTELVPAVFLSGGLHEVRLPGGLAARGYAQAGYVGGRLPTGFADGSLIAERPLWRDRGSLLAAGVGAWGGAQRGASRLDLGPSASLRFRLGEGTARVSADYRVRVAGNAAPAAGAAVTISAGF